MKFIPVLAMLAFATGAEAQMTPAGPSPNGALDAETLNWNRIDARPQP
ncbi:MAG TPA: hypothetical protein VHU87_02340 [Rhizomicrobium sp.]|jgi:hypothetical protein|nr:hypothetical protein [Rhizomicrobium sp.]